MKSLQLRLRNLSSPRDPKLSNPEIRDNVKVRNLPVESLTAYVFPLKDIDFVLGLSWLEKHNPHVDFRSKSYEFARNGRKYILHPARKPAKIRVAMPNEF